MCVFFCTFVPKFYARMKKTYWILCLLLLCGSGFLRANQADQKAARKLEQRLRKTPGDMTLRCEYVDVLLQLGDTVQAEETLDYGERLGEAGCMYLHRARIALSRGNTAHAALFCASAVNTGTLPDDEPLIMHVDSLTRGGVATRLDKTAKASKANTNALRALGQLRIHQGDTAAALTYYQEAYRRGDTTLISLIDSLRPSQLQTEDTVVARIPFTRTGDKIELTCHLNGLRIKAEIDTTATESSISGVETSFILKNDYVSRQDIIDNRVIVVREMKMGDGLVMRDVRLRYRRTQESPLILCLADLRRLGRVVINEREKVLEIRR